MAAAALKKPAPPHNYSTQFGESQFLWRGEKPRTAVPNLFDGTRNHVPQSQIFSMGRGTTSHSPRSFRWDEEPRTAVPGTLTFNRKFFFCLYSATVQNWF